MTAEGSGEAEERPGVESLRIEPVLRHGKGVARLPGGREGSGRSVDVPFALPGELVEAVSRSDAADWQLLRVVEGSAERVEPGCPHFGVCGGCQLQMASAPGQLRLKQAVLLDWLERAGVRNLPEVQVQAAEPWGYRNRIRLRVGRDEAGARRLGYNGRGSRRFLPVRTCPIGAPLLWRAAEALLLACGDSAEWAAWLGAAAEVELFADDRLERLQLLLLLETAVPGRPEVTFSRAMEVLRVSVPELAGAGAVLLGPSPRGHEGLRERTRTPVAAWGAAGLAYAAAGERFWVTRGGFFQVNRFLLPELVRLVCADRSGELAWDLFAGVGLFARVLARSFAQVVAVEGNPGAARDLHAALGKMGDRHRAVQAATLDFLREAAVQRERPGLVTLDPPRAGAGVEACELLLRLRAQEIVYVSCDPETLARDLAVLQRGYRLAAVHLLEMFPQTYHQETVVVLERRP